MKYDFLSEKGEMEVFKFEMMLNQVIEIMVTHQTIWLSVGAKAVYLVVYFAISYKLLDVATQKIKEGKENQKGDE